MGKKNNKKASSDEVISAAMTIVPELTDQSFHCYIANDDGGTHLVCAIERREDDSKDIKGHLPLRFMGWRSIILSVPNGYIKTFLKDK